MIVLESEAAAIYYSLMDVGLEENPSVSLTKPVLKTKFMIVDLGGMLYTVIQEIMFMRIID